MKWVRERRCQHKLSHQQSLFSGKLCPVTTQSEPKPSEGEAPAADHEPREIGGREGPEPTRYGDWELRGRCIDF
jgi:hypothetical protein